MDSEGTFEGSPSDMDRFYGTWTFVSCDNFDAYLKALGIALPLRKLASLISPSITIAAEGSNTCDPARYSVKTDAGVRAVTAVFSLGERIAESTVDLRSVSSVFSLDDCGRLVWTSTDRAGVVTVVTRSLEEDGVTMTVRMEVKGVTATAVFRRKG